MSSFTSPLIVRVEQGERSGRGLFTVMAPFEYHLEYEDSGMTITVPKGFVTDFASIPRFFRLLISPVGMHAKAALVHDALYNGIAVHGSRRCFPSRKISDEIFAQAMQVMNVPWTRRYTIYYSVRLFGWIAWKGADQVIARGAKRPARERQKNV